LDLLLQGITLKDGIGGFCMGKNRVVITGLGIVSTLGTTVEQWWDNLIQGFSKVDVINWMKLGEGITPLGAEIKDFDFDELFDQADTYKPYLDKGMQFGFVAAKQAYENAGLEKDRGLIDNDRFGIYVGTTTGGIKSMYNEVEKYVQSKNASEVDPNIIYTFPPSSWPSLLAHYFRANGPTKVVGTSCYAGGESIGNCYRDIKDGLIDVAVVGGLDAPIINLSYMSFYLIGATSRWKGKPEEACRPFSKDREGMVFGEGSAFFILENLDLALKRNARIFGEIIGYSATCDGDHMVHPTEEADRYSAAITQALKEAEISPEKICYVSCHGTGTHANDLAETNAIKKALGRHSRNVCVSSIKSMIGHSFGGATAIEILGLVKSLETKVVPPTINFEVEDPECDLNCVPNKAKKLPACEYVLKTATGFGGSNMAMVLRAWNLKEVG
jgi:3-oxoacyl-(acyl-carrier-protein) synthase